MMTAELEILMSDFVEDRVLAPEEAIRLTGVSDIAVLLRAAARRRDNAHGAIVSYSRKVFIPLTKLCRDVCHYCTFAHAPRDNEPAFLSREALLSIARAGRDAGCNEALFTLGDKPELRYRSAREALDGLGHPTTLSYLVEAARLVFDETGLLPHVNPGLLEAADLAALRKVSISQGMMLESTSPRLAQARRAAFWLARQGPGCATRHDPHSGRAARAVHYRHSHRHRRDQARADRGVTSAARAARNAWTHPGDHHPEFPSKTRHADGRGRGTYARRASLDDRDGAADIPGRP